MISSSKEYYMKLMGRSDLFAWHISQTWCSSSITTDLKNLKEKVMLFLDVQLSILWSKILKHKVKSFRWSCLFLLEKPNVWHLSKKWENRKANKTVFTWSKSVNNSSECERFCQQCYFLLHKILILPLLFHFILFWIGLGRLVVSSIHTLGSSSLLLASGILWNSFSDSDKPFFFLSVPYSFGDRMGRFSSVLSFFY